MHEVFVGGLVGVECGDGSIEVENKSLKRLVGVGGHRVFTGSP